MSIDTFTGSIIASTALAVGDSLAKAGAPGVTLDPATLIPLSAVLVVVGYAVKAGRILQKNENLSDDFTKLTDRVKELEAQHERDLEAKVDELSARKP